MQARPKPQQGPPRAAGIAPPAVPRGQPSALVLKRRARAPSVGLQVTAVLQALADASLALSVPVSILAGSSPAERGPLRALPRSESSSAPAALRIGPCALAPGRSFVRAGSCQAAKPLRPMFCA
jgi:hypothetical protein